MSLDYSYKNIENSKDVCFERVPASEVLDEMRTGMTEWYIEDDGSATRQSPITKTLIFMCIYIDLGEITEKNAADFYARAALYEKYNGVFVQSRQETDDDEDERKGKGWIELVGGGAYRIVDRPITPEDVRKHIGLSCNVANVARRSWVSKYMLARLDEFARRYEKEATCSPSV